jgi:hypothetical protein
MLKKGIIEPSSSPWSAPAILVPKRSLDGRPKYRFCVDFRALNKVTQFDAYQLPVFDETMSTLHGSNYFTTLDLLSGFRQINIAKRDKMKTTFSTTFGQYQFQRLAFGTSHSPASFRILLDIVLRDLKGTVCWDYLDDIV